MILVCDFGLARSIRTAEPGGDTGFMTEVSTRHILLVILCKCTDTFTSYTVCRYKMVSSAGDHVDFQAIHKSHRHVSNHSSQLITYAKMAFIHAIRWSIGCILGEMLSGKPMFPGRDYHHQISLILDVLGTPTLEEFYAINSRRSRDYLRAMPFRKRKPLAFLFPVGSHTSKISLEVKGDLKLILVTVSLHRTHPLKH